MNNTMMRGIKVQLLPFEGKYWETLAKWFYSEDYKGYFRQYNRMLTEDDFKQFDRLIAAEVFFIYSIDDNEIIGMIQAIPCMKKNKACYIGLLIDTKYQGKRFPMESMMIAMEHLFNRQGYNKIIIEILESNESLRKTVEKTGFYKEGKLIQECFIDGKFQNELRYSMTSFYYNKNKAKALEDYKQYLKG